MVESCRPSAPKTPKGFRVLGSRVQGFKLFGFQGLGLGSKQRILVVTVFGINQPLDMLDSESLKNYKCRALLMHHPDKAESAHYSIQQVEEGTGGRLWGFFW